MNNRCLDRNALRCGAEKITPSLRAVVYARVLEINERYKDVLSSHYQSNQTLKEIGEGLGISPARVRQIEMNAIRLIRRRLLERGYVLGTIRAAYSRTVREY